MCISDFWTFALGTEMTWLKSIEHDYIRVFKVSILQHMGISTDDFEVNATKIYLQFQLTLKQPLVDQPAKLAENELVLKKTYHINWHDKTYE